MSHPFDASLKALASFSPAEFLGAFDPHPGAPVSLLNVDLSTVSTAADLVFGVGDPLAAVHIDCQASAAEDVHRNVLAINALLHRQRRVPVSSLLILLRPQARHRNTTGVVDYSGGSGAGRMDFTYQMVEIWRRPAEELLNAALGVAPLAVLGGLPPETSTEDGITDVLHRLIRRLDREATPGRARNLATVAAVLTGLRLGREAAGGLIRGLNVMRESTVYQLIVEEGLAQGLAQGIAQGRAEGLAQGRAEGTVKSFHDILLRQGRRRFGEPDERTRAELHNVKDVPRLERLIDAVLDATGWDDLLSRP